MLVLALSTAVSAQVITSVVRANGNSANKPPIGEFTGSTPPLFWPEGGLQNGISRALTPYVFSDRVFWWNNVPEAMVGAEHIRTFNDDKEYAAENVTYTVTTSRTATFWVAVESRFITQTSSWYPAEDPTRPWASTSAPASWQQAIDWLTRGVAAPGTFTDTGMTLNHQEGDPGTQRTYNIFSAELPAGVYVLYYQGHRSISNYIFGTIPPPISAWDPDPFDGKDLVDVSQVLSWQAPEDPNFLEIMGYNVYLDPNETKVASADPTVRVSVGQPGTSFDPNPDLLYDTQYFWRVDTSVLYDDDPNETPVINAGPVWSFMTAPEVPLITLEPKGMTRGPACGRLDAELIVEAANATNYQWYKNGDAIIGANSATLTITGVTLADEGEYYCNASNAAGSVDSVAVWLEYARQTSQWSFDGDSLADAIGGHDIVLPDESNAVPTFDAGKIGDAIVLDGIDDYALIPAGSLPKNRSSLTLAFWAKNNTGSTVATTAFYANTAAEPGNRILSVQIPFTNNNAQFDLGNSDSGGSYDRVAAGMRAITDPWVYWVVTKDVETGTMRTYQNGVQLGQNTNAQRQVYGAEEFYLGARNLDVETGLGQFFNGSIDDLRIYNYALDPVEIAYLYNDVTDETVCVYPNDPVLQSFDYDGSCAIDLGDLAIFASNWLNCQRIPDCLERP